MQLSTTFFHSCRFYSKPTSVIADTLLWGATMQISSPIHRDAILERERRLLYGDELERSCIVERKKLEPDHSHGDVEMHNQASTQMHQNKASPNYEIKSLWVAKTSCHKHLSRKLARLKGIAGFLNIVSYNLKHLCRIKKYTQFRTSLQVTFTFLLLTTFFSLSTSAQSADKIQQQSHSHSPFQSWVIAEISDPGSELEVSYDGTQRQRQRQHEPFRFPDLIIPVNKLFQYQIPAEAFEVMETILHYKVPTATRSSYYPFFLTKKVAMMGSRKI